MTVDSSQEFEAEVLRIARNLWPTARGAGAANVYGRERDGIFETDYVVHIVEATTSRQKDKADKDIQKIVDWMKAIRRERKHDKFLKGWFITKYEPTADQRGVLDKFREFRANVEMRSLHSFRAELVNAQEYLSLRDKYRFGSVANPENEQIAVERSEYVEMDILSNADQKLFDLAHIRTSITEQNSKVLLVGDFGIGKSMTLRELYYQLRDQFNKGTSYAFPVHLNLRDHLGQHHPAEALERHARNVGLSDPSQLVKAWRSGYVIPLLDGFDELAASSASATAPRIRAIRSEAMTLVRRFVEESDELQSIVVAGRRHYFDSDREMLTTLGLEKRHPIVLTLNDFSEEQLGRYLKKKGLTGAIPDWLPSRPLLIGYLVAKKAIGDVTVAVLGNDVALGWDRLLDLICSRETNIRIGFDGATIRQILERLATRARATESSLGPIPEEEINSAFQQVVGHAPDALARDWLMRLPGLGVPMEQVSEQHTLSSQRWFIDLDLLDAARAGDIVRYIESPHAFPKSAFLGVRHELKTVGLAMASMVCKARMFTAKQVSSAMEATFEDVPTIVRYDLVGILLELHWDYVGKQIDFNNLYADEISFNEQMPDLSRISFHECLISRLELDGSVPEVKLPQFVSCVIGTLEGRSDETRLPKSKFFDTSVDEFIDVQMTTAAMMNGTAPVGAKVLAVTLKKLFVQKGSGRKSSALYRGLSQSEQAYVGPILELVRREGFAAPSKFGGDEIWIPVRSKAKRAHKIIAAPHDAQVDSIIRKANEAN